MASSNLGWCSSLRKCCRWLVDKIRTLCCCGQTTQYDDEEEGVEFLEKRRDTVESKYKVLYRNVTRELEDAKTEVQKMKDERDDALTKLSELMSSRLRENNPNIVDLSDQFRPTKLAEISSELYDNEWTNAVKVIEEAGSKDIEALKILLDIVMCSYLLCKDKVEKQWKEVVIMIGDDFDSQLRQVLIDKRKKHIGEQIPTLQTEIVQTLKSCVQEEKLWSLLSTGGPVRVYLDACVRLCLYMVVQDPPVVWYCPGWTSTNFAMEKSLVDDNEQGHADPAEDGRPFETKQFKCYRKGGDFVEFIVWPAMRLNTEGPVLYKGVAQGCSASTM